MEKRSSLHPNRDRVDEFFPAKKRRRSGISLSPGYKSDIRNEGEGKLPVESSPSKKGTLESFLVSTRGGVPNVTEGLTKAETQNRIGSQSYIKINRGEVHVDIQSEDKNAKKDGVIEQTDMSSAMIDTSLEQAVCVSNARISDGLRDKSEQLEVFANDFLSMCCRVESKRNGSEDLELPKKFNASLSTPKTVTGNKGHKSTPGWLRCNSFFSPGDDFWDEAIEAVDDLVITKVENLSQPGQKSNNAGVATCDMHVVPHVENELSSDRCEIDSKTCSREQGEPAVCHTPISDELHYAAKTDKGNDSLVDAVRNSAWKHTLVPSMLKCISNRTISEANGSEKLNESVDSPLPVRRFDFSSEQCLSNDHTDGVLDRSKEVIAGGIEKRSLNDVSTGSEKLELKKMHGGTTNGLKDSRNTESLQEVCSKASQVVKGRCDLDDVYCKRSESRCDDASSASKSKEAEGGQINQEVLPIMMVESVHSARKVTIPDREGIFTSPTSRFKEVEGVPDIQDAVNARIVDGTSTPSNKCDLKGASSTLEELLPDKAYAVYAKKGVSQLYQWQVECLQLDGVLQGRNLVYCASTSAGKSLVAEVLMLRRVFLTGKKAMLVLPYVSLCIEKAAHMESLLEPFGKRVQGFYGSQGSVNLPRNTSIVVCTIEKANSLINKLLEEGRLADFCAIVVDELHMVGDRDRGYLLELMLTKLRYAAGKGSVVVNEGTHEGSPNSSSGKTEQGAGLQIIGMSATMPNVAAVASWLQAALYQTDYRPVPLDELIKVGNCIYDRNMQIVRTIRKNSDLGGKDPDHVVELCNEIVQKGHSVLLFCSSRKACETSAKHVAKFLPVFEQVLRSNSSGISNASAAIEELQKCPAGLDPVLAETLLKGVAYHHAGLTVEEREVVETCYRTGVVRVLTATSTLAAGVNLPARRVIFRQPKIGLDFIDATRYKQMAGRAGRAGIDTKGESVVICKPDELKRVAALVNEGCQPLQSCLADDKNGMTRAILEVVASGIVQTAGDVHRYVRCTLLNSTEPFEEVIKAAQDSLRWLCHRKFLEWNQESELYITTPLGKAAFGSSLSPEESLVVFEDLAKAREGFVLASDLHLVYLVTPIHVELEPDWGVFYQKYAELSSLDQDFRPSYLTTLNCLEIRHVPTTCLRILDTCRQTLLDHKAVKCCLYGGLVCKTCKALFYLLVQAVGDKVGVTEPFLMRMAHGAPIMELRSRRNAKSPRVKPGYRVATNGAQKAADQMLRICRRFYVALILAKLVQEVPLMDVCEAFKVARGMAQSLQESAGRFAAMVSALCERVGWHDFSGLVSKFQNRVCFGVKAEIVELTEIPHVKAARARSLYKAGIRTPQAVAEASLSELVKALFEGSSWAAQDGSRNSFRRRIQMGVAKRIKNGARQIVLDQAEAARLAAFSAFQALGLSVPSALSQPLPDKVLDTDEQEEDIEFDDVSEDHPTKNENAISQCIDHKIKQQNLEQSVIVSNPEVTVGSAALEIIHSNQHKIPDSIGEAFRGSYIEQSTNNIISTNIETNQAQISDEGPIDVEKMNGGLDEFLLLWGSKNEYFFETHYTMATQHHKDLLFEVNGIAVCWLDSPVYYVSFCPKTRKNDTALSGRMENNDSNLIAINSSDSEVEPKKSNKWNETKSRLMKIASVLNKDGATKITWDWKQQLKAFRCPAVVLPNSGKVGGSAFASFKSARGAKDLCQLPSVSIEKPVIDLRIVAWLLWPDEESNDSPSLEQEVKRRLPGELAAKASRDGRWTNQMGMVAHNGCCRRAAQVRALYITVWKLLTAEGLDQPLKRVEMPMVSVLAEMEMVGICVDMEACRASMKVLEQKIQELESEAHRLAGLTFSLSVPAEVAHILFGHLKLSVPLVCNKGKQHPSTDKQALDALRGQHPIIEVIKEHRTLSKLLHSTLGPIVKRATLLKSEDGSQVSRGTFQHCIKGRWLQTSTATGRLSMEEPNLQCIEHTVSFSAGKDPLNAGDETGISQINPRDFFVPSQDNWIILTADYSQIEVRLMAHFSGDLSLLQLLNDPKGDLFRVLASRWKGIDASEVTGKQREQAKKLVYGILYGMGVSALAEQLECTATEAAKMHNQFKAAFPGVASWVHKTVETCRQKGYINTLGGRKRFLENINAGNQAQQAKAERQAVNSICQGSAADLIKIAMINLKAALHGDEEFTITNGVSCEKKNFSTLKGQCRLLLQIHDELVMEVDKAVVREVSALVRSCMQGAASLQVPLLVKLQIGPRWGSLRIFDETSDSNNL